MSSQENKFKQVDQYVFCTSQILGKGAFGQVVKGCKKETREEVAVKIVSMMHAVNQQNFIKNLNREIQILTHINNPNIVKLYKITQTANNIYMFLEFCNGGDLKQTIQKKGGKLSEAEAIVYFRQICEGFKELHKLGIIHRDIKPANILIHNGVVKIADFGFARTLDCTQLNYQQKMTYLGTPLYMSPQILEKGIFSSKCDIWSLGMVLYESIFGKTAWTGKSEQQLASNIENEKLQFPFQIECSHNSRDLLEKMLTKEDSLRISWEELFQHPVVCDSTISSIMQIQPNKEASDFLKAAEMCSVYFATMKVVGVDKINYLPQKPLQGDISPNFVPANSLQIEFQKSIQDIQTYSMQDEEEEEKKKVNQEISKKVDAGMTFHRNANSLFSYLTCLIFDLYCNQQLFVNNDLFLRISFVFMKFYLIRTKRLEQLLSSQNSPQIEFSEEEWQIYLSSKLKQNTLELILKDASIAEPYMKQIIQSLYNEPKIANIQEQDSSSQLLLSVLNSDYIFNGTFIKSSLKVQQTNLILQTEKMCLVSLDADSVFKIDLSDFGQTQFLQFYVNYERMEEFQLEAEVKSQLQAIFAALGNQ